MAAATLDLVGEDRVEQGASYTLRVYMTSSTTDFTGSTAAAMIRKKYSDALPQATFTCTPGNDVGYPATGRYWFDLTLTPVETAAITVDAAQSYRKKTFKYCYDLEVTLADTSVLRMLEGAIEISPEVTQ